MAKKKYVCSDCKLYINNTCAHESNIKILLQKRVQKKVYKNIKLKTECNYVQPKA